MPTPKEKLRQIREMIKSGKRKQAVKMLTVLIEHDHDNPDLWWLLANAADDPMQARMALDELLALRPDDERAKKLLDRIETRQLLTQMGFKKQQASFIARNRTAIFAGVVATMVLLVLVVALIAVTNQNNANNVARVQPTALSFPTATDVPPTESVVVVPTDVAPLETVEVSAPDTDTSDTAAPEVVVDDTSAEVVVPDSDTSDSVTADTVAPEATEEVSAPRTNTDFSLEVEPEVTVEVSAPTPIPQQVVSGDVDLPSSDGKSVEERLEELRNTAGTNFNTTTAEGQSPPPESTAEVSVPPVAQTTSTPPVAPSPTAAPVTVRGQIIDREPKQELIQPYGEHGWTFSGYRDEQITLELVNITGRGNPSLELRNSRDEIIASDIDVINGSNKDAFISLNLPADGIYTVVVRMASVDEQLYYLLLKRG